MRHTRSITIAHRTHARQVLCAVVMARSEAAKLLMLVTQF